MSLVTPPPWQGKELSYGARLGLLILSGVLLSIALVSFFIAIGVGGSLLRGAVAPGQINADRIAVMGAVVVFIASCGGIIAIWPYTRGAARFTPAYGPIAPETTGHPFEVRYQRYLWGRSMRGKGTAQFAPDALLVEGYVEPHALLQVGIVLALTILPLVFFGFGLGIIPALIIGYYVGRKRVALHLPYTTLRSVTVNGRQLTLRGDQTPRTITLAVASIDGERLYREIQQRFPAAIATR